MDVVFRDLATWRRLFKSPRAGRENLMTPSERIRFDALPDRVDVFRGFGFPAGRLGIAWTLDCHRAEFFARDFAGSPRMRWLGAPAPTGAWVAHATVKRQSLLAYLNDRRENEVLIPSLRGLRVRYSTVGDEQRD
jgi:hypothetical protein